MMRVIKKNNKKKVLTLFLATAVFLLFIAFAGSIIYKKQTSAVRLETFQVHNGWGYRILTSEKTIIYQPIIPTLATERPFPTKESAWKVGELVLSRLLKQEDFSVTREEVETCLPPAFSPKINKGTTGNRE